MGKERDMRKMMLGFLFFILAAKGSAQTDEALPAGKPLTLSLPALVQEACQNNGKLKSAKLEFEASQSEAHSAGAAEFPRIGVGGNYFYQSYVPELSIVPAQPAKPFGEADNWSAWATLNWDLWDFRSQHNLANSATAASQSQEQMYQAALRQVVLAVRMAYFQTQISLEQVRLLGDSLKVAQAQYADIGHQARFGTASRMDLLSSHQEVLNYQRQFSQAQAGLAQSLRDLFDLVDEKEPEDFTAPLDNRMQGALPEGVNPPTVWLTMDSEKDSLEALEKETATPPDDSAPQLRTYAYLADSARFASEAAHSELFPKLTLSAQAGYENPDGPILKTIQQNMVGVSLSMPIFDWGQIVNDSDSKKKQSEAYLSDLNQAKTDLLRDWNKAGDSLRSLQYQQTLNQTAVLETQELSKLTYDSYRAGTVRFLEVQTANFQALDAKVLSVSNDVQILMQLSVLSSLSGKEPSHE